MDWIGSLRESWEELGNVALAGLSLDMGVEGQAHQSGILSVSKFKGHYCLTAFPVLPPPVSPRIGEMPFNFSLPLVVWLLRSFSGKN